MLERYDEKYLMRWFCNQTRNNDLTVLFEDAGLRHLQTDRAFMSKVMVFGKT